MRGIEKQAAYLGQLNQQYIPFANKLTELAKGFEEQELLALVQHYMPNNEIVFSVT